MMRLSNTDVLREAEDRRDGVQSEEYVGAADGTITSSIGVIARSPSRVVTLKLNTENRQRRYRKCSGP
jgi:hypothetical protein